MIPEAQYAKSLLFYPCGSLLVVYGLSLMLPSVNLNDNAFFQAYEVDNIASEGLLSPEFVSTKLTQSEVPP